MNFLLFSSPYEYYKDNLIKLNKHLIKKNHNVYDSYMLGDNVEKKISENKKVNYSKDFLKGIIKPDVVILTQCWWGVDNLIAKHCQKKKIPFYIIDHASPMMRYTEANGKKSHLYRSDCLGAKAFFSYGPATVEVMKEVGFKGKNIPIGSDRLESFFLPDSKNNKDWHTETDGYVLFDTSHRMDDKNLVPLFVDFVKNHSDDIFLIREHIRSPGYFREALKYSNVKLNDSLTEIQLQSYSNFIFTFPSSAMIVPAMKAKNNNKNIYALYENHMCVEARNYFKKYQECIPQLGSKSNNDYDNFVSNNITYRIRDRAYERIYKYIMEDLK